MCLLLLPLGTTCVTLTMSLLEHARAAFISDTFNLHTCRPSEIEDEPDPSKRDCILAEQVRTPTALHALAHTLTTRTHCAVGRVDRAVVPVAPGGPEHRRI